MKYLLSIASLLATTIAKDVVCMVNDEAVATVDLDTGVCPFTIPEDLPVEFDFTSTEDYNVIFYYAVAQASKYFNDIPAEGRTINIPANLLYGLESTPLFQVSDSKTPAANSTEALRKRLLGKTALYSRDAESDFVASLEGEEGTELPGQTFAVVDPSVASSEVADASSAAGGELTVTNSHTTVMTITSCSDNKCSETEVPATEVVTTVTSEGIVTAYTTVCPLTEEGTTTETEFSTTVMTITSCADNKCHETVVPAKETVTTETVEGVETIYTTYCPLSDESSAPAPTTLAPESYDATSTEYVTSYITITSCGANGCEEKSMVETVTTVTVNGVETAYTTYCPIEEATTGAETSTVGYANSTAPVTTPIVAPTTSLNTTDVVTVCTGPDCDTTTTVQAVVTVSVSGGASPSVEADVSTFEAGAATNVGGITSIVALVGAIVYLL
ncbi:yeast-form wall Protein 1 [[Candida] jaroonii]|uniref:Yeast-form wall Protein 1 n=1 Tax=[Candida] jaroonii TaxID=467808 RepID=A0ACA9Y0S0_9ASCO|nr:yeast-form wall Protein 1 [[Candida] jaroonii]